MKLLRSVVGLLGLAASVAVQAATYFVDPERGDDSRPGTEAAQPWRSLARASRAELRPGDRLALAGGVRHVGTLRGERWSGTADAPVVLTSYSVAGEATVAPAVVDGRGWPAAIHLRNARHVTVENLRATADGGGWPTSQPPASAFRCGVLIEYDEPGAFAGIVLRGVQVRDVSFEERGFVRPEHDVRTENGTTRYGWGVRFIVHSARATVSGVTVQDCRIERVDHTGLKFTAPPAGIREVRVERVTVSDVGGPGVQLSGVSGGRFSSLEVDRTGSTSDPRHWGRGSGLWTWGSSDVVIERSRFTNAHGPGDSAGVHIDYNCRDVIVQYNFSAENAGGFCEILGNNHNCAYRYNISVNDGRRVKGRDGAFQEGKSLWLSGYVGKAPPRGPFNSYIYNNTVYVGSEIEPKVAIAPTAEGVLVANNIFYFQRPVRIVAGDQMKQDRLARTPVRRAVFANNLVLVADDWPAQCGMPATAAIVGDPRFVHPGGRRVEDYVPQEISLVKDRGLVIPLLPGDATGLRPGLAVPQDFRGQPIVGPPDLGAIELP